jgi:hypothetical protein
MLTCHDGFVRLTLDAVLSVPFKHLVSGLDEDTGAGACGSTTTISGYTEWVSAGNPSITVGWDWAIEPHAGAPGWRRIGLPRSNVMLVDRTRADYPWERNLAVLATVVDAIPWQEHAQTAIAARYAA